MIPVDQTTFGLPTTERDGEEVEMKNRGFIVAQEKQGILRDIYMHADNLNNIRGTAYGVLNMFSEYQQHHVEGRNTRGTTEKTADLARYENRFERILGGQSLDHEVFAALTK